LAKYATKLIHGWALLWFNYLSC